MHWLDWTILLATLGFIVGYGVWRTRSTNTVSRYLRGDNEDRWWAVTLSVMATQASAITFLSTPGQGFLDGMGFVQFYFGLPLAMVVIGWVFIPLYYKWNVYTAYEFIGKRFDHRTRLLTAILFLIQRGLSTGITIYAPSIVLSKVLHWPLGWTCVFIGALVILYTTTGGAKAVGLTHKQQMAVMFAGLLVAFGLILYYLKDTLSFGESLSLAGAMGKLNVIDLSWDPNEKYTLWSGLIGGFFLQLSYFGTDQSQVQRYLGGRSARQARSGLLMNGLVKIPMQFFILLIGVMVFVFYLFTPAPVHWNEANVTEMHKEATATAQPRNGANSIESMHAQNATSIQDAARTLVQAQRGGKDGNILIAEKELSEALGRDKTLRDEYTEQVKAHLPDAEPNDKDYIFISFIMDHMPVGIIGLLLAMIFCAGMGSTSSQLSALATTAVVDVFRTGGTGERQVVATKWATVAFGVLALCFAAVFSLFENLIQAVNILGSLFYGTILGIFLVAFFLKRIGGTAVFIAALVSQAAILIIHFTGIEIAFLWYNLIAPAIVVVLALLLQPLMAGGLRSAG
ncbi:MAG: sodium:solute symporter [Flavobacteriales bacterium]|nr:sodium:solute symporter [Flavobacteriales bacterium]MBP6698447.1 sodium:solute symporter [Flavobacteriales bacterium]